MEDCYRKNVVDFCLIYLDKDFDSLDIGDIDFVTYIFTQLFNLDLDKDGYGQDHSTKKMTNDIGDLKIYNEFDPNKFKYLEDIKNGDLLFFHTNNLSDNTPTPNNCYPGHVGIYLGNLEFIHVSLNDNKITIDKLNNNWINILVGSRDIIKNIVNNKDYV